MLYASLFAAVDDDVELHDSLASVQNVSRMANEYSRQSETFAVEPVRHGVLNETQPTASRTSAWVSIGVQKGPLIVVRPWRWTGSSCCFGPLPGVLI